MKLHPASIKNYACQNCDVDGKCISSESWAYPGAYAFSIEDTGFLSQAIRPRKNLLRSYICIEGGKGQAARQSGSPIRFQLPS